MKIVLDCEQMKHPNTGLNTFCRFLAEGMINTLTQEDKLSFFISPKTDNCFGNKYNYIKIHCWNKQMPIFFKPFLDIWHTTFQLSRYTGGGFSTKKIITIHDLNFLYENTSPAHFERNMRKYQKYIDRVDHIVAISEFVRKDILEHLDTKNKPVSVVYNGHAIDEFPDFDAPIYRPEKPFIFAVGMLNSKKNFHVLPCLLKNNDYELIIAGKSDKHDMMYLEKIKEEAKLHGVSDRLKIVGEISSKDKYWYLKNCLSFAFPSIAEGFGLPVLEAMHFGKPIFLSNLTSLPEIGGDQAYYFENFDSVYMQNIFDLGLNDFFQNNKAEQVKLYKSKFSWDKCAKEYYQIYQGLLR